MRRGQAVTGPALLERRRAQLGRHPCHILRGPHLRIMTTYSSIYSVMIAASLVATSCAVDEGENVETDDVGGETLGTSSQSLTSYITGTWTVGQGARPLASSADYFCFLSKVTGAFAGGGEWVDVYGSNGWWYVSGGSLQGALSATATCVKYTAFANVAYGWTPTSMPVVSNNTQNVTGLWDMAWLSSMQGEFRGGGEWLTVFADVGAWNAQAHALSGGGVRGRVVTARLHSANNAIRNPNYFGPVSQSAPLDGHTYDNDDVDLGSASDRVCYLTRISGRFSGYGEWAEVKLAGGRWWLRTDADRYSTGVSATAQCVSFN